MRVIGKFNAWSDQKDGEYKKKSYYQEICHYPHRGIDGGQHGTTEYKSTDSPLPPL